MQIQVLALLTGILQILVTGQLLTTDIIPAELLAGSGAYVQNLRISSSGISLNLLPSASGGLSDAMEASGTLTIYARSAFLVVYFDGRDVLNPYFFVEDADTVSAFLTEYEELSESIRQETTLILNDHAVDNSPTLDNVDDQYNAIGDVVDITLPEGVGGSAPLFYSLVYGFSW